MFVNFVQYCIILYLAVFLKSVDTFQSPENRTAETDTLYDDPHKFLHASVLQLTKYLPELKMFQTKLSEKNESHILHPVSVLLRKTCGFEGR